MLRLAVLSTVFLTTGCASMFLKGGILVDSEFKPKVLVKYTAEGQVPEGAKYSLVRFEGAVGILERTSDGTGAFFSNHWRTANEDHYAGWVATSHGYEFVIPVDRSQPGKKYVYPAGTYEVETIQDVDRPVPAAFVAPVAKLIPIGQERAPAPAPEASEAYVAPAPAPAPASAPAAAPVPVAAPSAKTGLTTIKTSDGKVYRGRVITETSKGFLFRPVSGETQLIEFERVVEMTEAPAR